MTRVVVPAIGLFAVTGALALVALAPVVLFSSSNEAGPLPSAPAATIRAAARGAGPRPRADRGGKKSRKRSPGERSDPGPGVPRMSLALMRATVL